MPTGSMHSTSRATHIAGQATKDRKLCIVAAMQYDLLL